MAPVPAWTAGPNTGLLSVSQQVYSKKAVLSAAYKYSDRAAVLVDVDGEGRWALFVVAPAQVEVTPLLEGLSKELVDQALRERLEQEFGAVRELIVAQAFSEGNLLDPEDAPVDERTDGA